MILVDVNLLIFAYDNTSEFHDAARTWWESLLSQAQPVRIARSTMTAFLRITTNPRAMRRPLSMPAAVEVVNEWISRPMVDILDAGPRHWQILSDLLQQSQVTGPLVSDADLAAIALEHGAVFCTHDRDFDRFVRAGLRVEYPIPIQLQPQEDASPEIERHLEL